MQFPAFPIAKINFLYSCRPDTERIPVLDSMTFFVTETDKILVHSFAHTAVRITRKNEVGWH